MPFMKGPAPIRRTLRYLQHGDLILKKNVKAMTINYNVDQRSSNGAHEFTFWEFPRIQYKNPTVQLLKFKNITPTPFIQFFFDNGEKLVVDVYGKERREIHAHIKRTFCVPQEELDAKVKREMLNPANFGTECDRYCICEVPGQVPCPSFVPLPEHIKGMKKKDKAQENS